MRILIYGGHGWIGTQVRQLLEQSFHEYRIAAGRADDEASIRREIHAYGPTHVLCMVGRTHGPGFTTIDYLEQPDKLPENLHDNLVAPLLLAMVCTQFKLHFTYLGTGCIFNTTDPEETAYPETAQPDFFGSNYSIVKGATDVLMHALPVLNLRIRMPIVDFAHPRNFITKLLGYPKICSIPNSMSVLPELLPIMLDMMERGHVGTLNFTNPGVISHNEILECYRDCHDPTLTWENMTLDEQDQILRAKRSNNQLDTSSLLKLYPSVTPIREAVQRCIQRYR